jgi:hypothetical protein
MSFLNVNQISTAAGTPSFTTGSNTINFGTQSIGASSASTMKNRIINGAMAISQRSANNAVTPTGGGAYNVDRWALQYSQVSKLTVQQQTPTTSGYVTPPPGFTNYLNIKVAATATVSASDYFDLYQAIEGLNIADLAWGTASAKTVTLSFWVYSNVTGTFSGALGNSAGTQSYPFNYTISNTNTWTQISVTIPGSVTGVWANDNTWGIGINFNLGSGSTYSATAGAWQSGNYFASTGSTSIMGSTSNYWNITGVQLEVGSAATSFDFRHYTQELQLCQRYYWQAGGTSVNETVGGGTAYSTTWAYAIVKTPTTMRTVPSLTKINSWGWNDYVGAAINGNALTLNTGNSTKDFLFIESQATATGLTQYRFYYLLALNDINARLQFSAEL